MRIQTVRSAASVAALDWRGFAALVHELARRAEPTGPRVVAVDGYSGAGKTWLAERLAAGLGAELHHVDELIPGWRALAVGLTAIERDLLRPWSAGAAGRVRVHDWDTGLTGPAQTREPPQLAVLEGSGIASLPAGCGLGVRIWVHTPGRLRRSRLDARHDRLDYLPYRRVWAEQEVALVRERHTPQRCDLWVREADGSGVLLALDRCRARSRSAVLS